LIEEDRGDEEEVQALKTIRTQITTLAQDLQQATESFELLAKLWKQRDKLEDDLNEKNETILRLKQRIDELEDLQASVPLTPSTEQPMGAPAEVVYQQRFLEKLSIALSKVFINTRSLENLPTKLTKSIEETENILLEDGPPEMKVIAALGRLGGTAAPSVLKTETSLTQGEVNKAIDALHATGTILEEIPGIFQLTTIKTMEPSISQLGPLASVPEIFSHCKRFIEATTETEEIASTLNVMRDALFTKGVSGVVIAEISKEARKWRAGSGNKDDLMELLTAWEERAPT